MVYARIENVNRDFSYGVLVRRLSGKMGRKLGVFRAVYLVSASCMGSFAFAFDTGVISTPPSLPLSL